MSNEIPGAGYAPLEAASENTGPGASASAGAAQIQEPLHCVSQLDQPYGSVSRKCDYCGAMCWPGMKGSSLRWVVDDWSAWEAASDNCRTMLTKTRHP